MSKCTPGGKNYTSLLRKCLLGSNFLTEWGAILDILRNLKSAVKKMALNKMESVSMSHEMDI